MKYMQKLQLNHISQENSQSILPLKSLVQNLCPHIEIKYGMEKYDYSQLLQDKSIWGLLPYIREICKRNDIEYSLEFNAKPEDIDESTIKSFIKYLKIPYKARDYQISSILCGARKCRSLFVCPTASGNR